jgi:arsenite oxidase small subunit
VSEQGSRPPAWKDDFPISWVDDDFVTRREFTKSLVWVSCASFAANLALAAGAVVQKDGAFPPAKIAEVGDLAVGDAHVFHDPKGEPCVLVRLAEDRFVAFAQGCTHLGCPVLYEKESQRLLCPCHEGAFDAASGSVLSGPPPRPLRVIAVERRGDELWAFGGRA